ncbi:MAG TPA: hypothetical protein VFH48_06680 [Chloroflexota bacterium]|nr:hypothetical protein [Chloroflexota bacterium]
MSASDRFKPYAPDVQAGVRLEDALPPEHSVHVFGALGRSVDLGHVVIPPGPKGEQPSQPQALFGSLAWG